MSEPINTHNMRIEFGKHRGELVTRLPIDYLEWHINEGTQFAPVAQAELDRRGFNPDTNNKVDVSKHAIDRASLRVLHIWQRERKPKEGIYSWLARVSLEGIENLKPDQTRQNFRIEYADLTLVFKQGKLYPTLVTVIDPKTIKNI